MIVNSALIVKQTCFEKTIVPSWLFLCFRSFNSDAFTIAISHFAVERGFVIMAFAPRAELFWGPTTVSSAD